MVGPAAASKEMQMSLLEKNTVLININRWQNRSRPIVRRNLAEAEITHSYDVTLDSKRFLLFDSCAEDVRRFIKSSSQMLNSNTFVEVMFYSLTVLLRRSLIFLDNYIQCMEWYLNMSSLWYMS